MIAFVTVMFLLFWATMIGQEFLSPWTVMSWWGPAEVYVLLPWAFFFSLALAVPFPIMLGFAALAGFSWDARWQVAGDDAGLPFGSSIVLFAVFGTILQGIRPLFRRGNWILPMVMVGLAVWFQLAAQSLLLSFRRGSFEFSRELWLTVLVSSASAILVSPLLFWLNSRIARRCGYPLEIEQFSFRRTYVHQI